MNTKQVEEATGITRQNIRYYEDANGKEGAKGCRRVPLQSVYVIGINIKRHRFKSILNAVIW